MPQNVWASARVLASGLALWVGLISCSGVAVFPQASLQRPGTLAGTAFCLLHRWVH